LADKEAATPPWHDPTPIRLAVSSCILGNEVRFDGQHKLSRYLRDTLGAYVEYVPVCPEVDIGLGIPRETLRLIEGEGGEDDIRLVTTRTGKEHTRTMRAYALEKAGELAGLELHGAIVQKGSPSCGMERVRVYPAKGGAARKRGTGLFTRALRERLPWLPIEEDGRMNDPGLRENFIERIFAYRRVRALFAGKWTRGDLVRFHTREKLLLMAHDRPTYTALGKLVAGVKGRSPREVVLEYEERFMRGLVKSATRRKHTNVLQHAAGYFKKTLDAGDKAELHEVIDRYHGGELPLIVPMTLLKHHVRKYSVDYLASQTYLDPHPRELALRNHV
jgi:uncharacterized protein YbgA (DUF1722 family)/uncharacterized protein YbbK (DUF523 family)